MHGGSQLFLPDYIETGSQLEFIGQYKYYYVCMWCTT